MGFGFRVGVPGMSVGLDSSSAHLGRRQDVDRVRPLLRVEFPRRQSTAHQYTAYDTLSCGRPLSRATGPGAPSGGAGSAGGGARCRHHSVARAEAADDQRSPAVLPREGGFCGWRGSAGDGRATLRAHAADRRRHGRLRRRERDDAIPPALAFLHLADGLGKKDFPVAHDTYDGGTLLMDEAGRGAGAVSRPGGPASVARRWSRRRGGGSRSGLWGWRVRGSGGPGSRRTARPAGTDG